MIVGHGAVGERVVGFFLVAVALHDQQERLIVGALVGENGFDARPNLIPDFTPYDARGFAERLGMLAAEDTFVGVVVEVDEFIAPPDEHRLARRQDNANAGPQILRPGADGSKGRFRPVLGAHQFAKFAASTKKPETLVGFFRSMSALQALCLQTIRVHEASPTEGSYSYTDDQARSRTTGHTSPGSGKNVRC